MPIILKIYSMHSQKFYYYFLPKRKRGEPYISRPKAKCLLDAGKEFSNFAHPLKETPRFLATLNGQD